MRIRAALVLLIATPACVPWEPPASEPATTSGIVFPDATTTGWDLPPRERGKDPSTTTSTSTTISTTAPPDPDTGPADLSTGEPPLPIDLAALQIVEVHPDPDGKDGGPDSPEFVELLHVGDRPLALAGLEVVARAWPTLRASELGLADTTLLPGQRLLLLRYAAASDLPDPRIASDEAGVRLAFASGEGLRNADGGVLLRAGDVTGDLLIYGAAQPAPWDSSWTGPPAPTPGSGSSLCRSSGDDHDDAGDWIVCPPSPGAPDEEAAGTSGTIESGTTGEPLPAEVAIVEVLSNPVGPGDLEKHAEFVEVINLGPGTVDLAGWTIADALEDKPTGVDALFYGSGDGGCAPETCLAAGRRAIIVGNVYTGPKGPGLVLVTDDTTIANAGLAVHEPVALRDPEGALRSTYRAWPDPLALPDPALNEEALVRVAPEAADEPAGWAFAAPTPGE